MSAAAKIALESASKEFTGRGETVLALQPTTIEIAREQFVALVGPSGCGKSTVLNMIGGLQAPTTGRVVYDGRPVSELELLGYDAREQVYTCDAFTSPGGATHLKGGASGEVWTWEGAALA